MCALWQNKRTYSQYCDITWTTDTSSFLTMLTSGVHSLGSAQGTVRMGLHATKVVSAFRISFRRQTLPCNTPPSPHPATHRHPRTTEEDFCLLCWNQYQLFQVWHKATWKSSQWTHTKYGTENVWRLVHISPVITIIRVFCLEESSCCYCCWWWWWRWKVIY